MVAPLGMYVRPLMASAERWIGPRQRWSGNRVESIQVRQNSVVVASFSCADATSSGAASSSAHDSAQYTSSPARRTRRARAVSPSMPSGRSVRRPIRCPAPSATADRRSAASSVHLAGVRP